MSRRGRRLSSPRARAKPRKRPALPSRRTFLLALGATSATGTLACLSLPAVAAGVSPTSATAITRVYGDGIRFIAVAITYASPVSAQDLKASDFRVPGRTVTAVYPATSADPATRADRGPVVIVALSDADADAVLTVQPAHMGPPGGDMKGDPTGGPPGGPAGGPSGGRPDWKVGQRNITDTTWREPQATVSAGGKSLRTNQVKNLVLDAFQQRVWHDPHTGRTLPYNLYVPKDHDPRNANRRFPLVNFMHDAGTCSDDPLVTLKQGQGAIVWANPDEQAKRPCFVLAPQFAEIVASENNQTSDMLDTTINLIKALCEEFHIDTRRLYTTGQSGGGMLSMAMNVKYPHFFAASFLVACQWGAEVVAPMAGNRLFILTSQDDFGAFPGQNADTEALEMAGAKVARAIWDGTWSAEQRRFAFDMLDAQHARINYVTFAKGTVIPPGASTEGAAGHRNTWRLAYDIEPIREWLFRTEGPASTHPA